MFLKILEYGMQHSQSENFFEKIVAKICLLLSAAEANRIEKRMAKVELPEIEEEQDKEEALHILNKIMKSEK